MSNLTEMEERALVMWGEAAVHGIDSREGVGFGGFPSTSTSTSNENLAMAEPEIVPSNATNLDPTETYTTETLVETPILTNTSTSKNRRRGI